MGGFAASRILEVHGERMIKRTFNPGFRIGLHQKDLSLALQGARASACAAADGRGAAQLMQACAANGMRTWTIRRWCALELMAKPRGGQGLRSGPRHAEPLTDPAPSAQPVRRRGRQRALPAQNTAAYLPPPPKGPHRSDRAGQGRRRDGAAVDAHWPAGRAAVRAWWSRATTTAAGLQGKSQAHRGGRGRHPVPDDGPPRRAAHRGACAGADGRRPRAVPDLRRRLGAAVAASARASRWRTSAINKALLRSGAAIDEMNCVRKHLSAIKGGRLAARARRAVTLLISDVPGDAPEVIASGPTVPDADLRRRAGDPAALRHRHAADRAGLFGAAPSSRLPGDARFAGHQVHMIATPRQSLEAKASAAGIDAHILSDEIEGESARSARCTPRWRVRWRTPARRSRSPASSSAAARPR